MQWVIAMPDNDFDATVDSWWRKVKQEKEQRKQQQQQQQHYNNSRYNIDTSHWQKHKMELNADDDGADMSVAAKQPKPMAKLRKPKTHKEKQAKQQRNAKHVDVAEVQQRCKHAEAKVQQRLEKQLAKQEQKEVLALLKADKKKAQDAQRFCEKERKAQKRVEGSEEGLQ